MDVLYQPYVQIRSTSAIVYTKYLGGRRKSLFERQKELEKHSIHNFQQNKAYSGMLSIGATKRMRKAIELLVESTEQRTIFSTVVNKNIQHKLSFITLTIPTAEKIELKTATKLLLEPMIRHLRQVHGMSSYVWKVELQKRGQLHYHITSNCYVPHSELRNKWNQLLIKHDFMSEYVQQKGHTNANSTDVHSVRKVRDLSAYLVKYFTKQEQNPVALKGKIWDCSKNLKVAKYFETELTEDIEYDIFQQEQAGNCVIKRSESFSFIKFKNRKSVTIFPKLTRKAYWEHMVKIRSHHQDLFNRPIINTSVQNLVHQKKDSTEIHFTGQQLRLNI